MNRILKIVVAVWCAVLLSNVSLAQVKSDYNKDADFSTYKTYTFAGWEKKSDSTLNEFDKKRILDALKAEFSARGMEVVNTDADAVITLFIVVDQKSSTTAYTDYNSGLGYGGRGWGWGYGAGGTATTTYSESDYKEGTLVVDMYDADNKDLLWQGVMVTTVNEKPAKRDKTVPKKIKKLMKSYPVAASK
ncbi:hypothetical protein BFP72_11565 [Reichenbachiella sp. 5M10]|uniref:DUF4136 domain-containing protein n=1 Tax=Reichenbachiella sp. 5M10 TaxID=1889772 RepID=UPI000C15F2E7|nr:DUF4136 domain-containing protein [Reichenbachiella sp. 5M10]PIB35986.1 hypothetical protein BFP72_11565 [Reichenbachiella sp. 5M10]